MTIPLTVLGDVRSIILTPMLGWKFEYNVNPLIVNTATSGTGSVSWNNSTAILSTAGASDSAKITTIRNCASISGVGIVIRFTAAFTKDAANCTQIIGLGDDQDGFFFGYNGVDWSILYLTAGTSHWIKSSDWNSNSEFVNTIDPSTLNVYQITFPASRVGLISFYIQDPVGGDWVLVHTLQNGNQGLMPAIYHVNMPLVAKVTSTGNTNTVSLYTSSAAALREGQENEYLPEVHQHVTASKTGLVTETAIVSLQSATTFAGVTNGKTCFFETLSAAVESNSPVSLRFIKNPTITGSFSNVNTGASVMMYDAATTVFSGGTELYTFMFSKSDSTFLELETMQIMLTNNDILTIAASPLGTTTSDVYVTVSWEED